MPVELGVPGDRLRDIARALKRGFDDLQETDSGWRFVQFDHPVWGRQPARSKAERIPGNLVVSADEPAAEVDAIVVVVGFVDSFTGDVHLGNGMVVPGPGGEEPEADDDVAGGHPGERLPAVALFDEHGLQALIGSIHETVESRFEPAGVGPVAETAIVAWLQAVVHENRR